MEIRSRLAVTRGEGKRDKQGKDGERSSQRTCIKDPWTWTTGWGLTMGAGGGQGRGQQQEKKWDNCN